MNYWIGIAFSVLFELLKHDPQTAAKFKAAFIKLARIIDATFPGEVCSNGPDSH